MHAYFPEDYAFIRTELNYNNQILISYFPLLEKSRVTNRSWENPALLMVLDHITFAHAIPCLVTSGGGNFIPAQTFFNPACPN